MAKILFSGRSFGARIYLAYPQYTGGRLYGLEAWGFGNIAQATVSTRPARFRLGPESRTV